MDSEQQELHPRLNRELITVDKMIGLYCDAHHNSSETCEACTSLRTYAERRLLNCRYQEEKPTCANCPIHCYGTKRRDQIKEVMKYAGPKMLFKHPVLAIRHLLDGKKRVDNPSVR